MHRTDRINLKLILPLSKSQVKTAADGNLCGARYKGSEIYTKTLQTGVFFFVYL